MNTVKRLLPLLLLVLLTACAGTGDSAGTSTGRAWAVSAVSDPAEIPRELRYTVADYSYLTGLHDLDYEAMSVKDFARAAADWTDETTFHRSEERLQRLLYSLPEDDGLYAFLHSTLACSWQECRVRHYNACPQASYPSYDSQAVWEKYGDVYGDPILLAQGEVWYWLTYAVEDDALTVRERDAFLNAVDQGMQAFLDAQSETALKNGEKMTKALQKELKRLCGQGASGIRAVSWDAEYQWWGETGWETTAG